MGNNISNKPCICGSDKKYKKCYGIIESNNFCKSFLEENTKGYIIKIQKYIDNIIAETSGSSKLLIQSKYSRSLLLIIFSYFECMAKIWSIYNLQDESKKKESFTNRYSAFCTSINNEYRNNENFPKKDIIYKIRSSLLHSLALSKSYNGITIMIINGNGFKELENKRTKMSQSKKHKILILSPHELLLLGVKGGQLMIDEINKNSSSNDHLIGLRNINTELNKESAHEIKKEGNIWI